MELKYSNEDRYYRTRLCWNCNQTWFSTFYNVLTYDKFDLGKSTHPKYQTW